VLSIAGMAIMTALSWVLDRAKEVPTLFVDVSEVDIAESALKPKPALGAV
jgi:hypothetical protein